MHRKWRYTDRLVESSGSPDADLYRLPRHRPVHLFHSSGVSPRPGMVHPAAPSQEQAGAPLPAAAAVLHRLLGTAAGARLGVHVVRAPGGVGHAGHRNQELIIREGEELFSREEGRR